MITQTVKIQWYEIEVDGLPKEDEIRGVLVSCGDEVMTLDFEYGRFADVNGCGIWNATHWAYPLPIPDNK